MLPKERVEIALRGGKPDRVPIVPIYDYSYVMRSIGRDPRQRFVGPADDLIRYNEESFLRHAVYGMFVHFGIAPDWHEKHVVEKRDAYWLVTELETGEQYRLLPEGLRVEADGRLSTTDGTSQIQTWDDLARHAPVPPTEAEIEASGRLEPLRHLCQTYPDTHFSFQSGTPLVYALQACGGFVEGLVTMATERELFRELLARCAQAQIAWLEPGARAGAHSTWFTSYYTGADTISPKDYAELIFPYEREVCQAARNLGLFVLDWFLGDLMPILDKVLELPIDALVLEQGRKGYDIDPVAIRRRVGPRFCLFGFGFENDYCTFDRAGLSGEIKRQIEGAGREGAFIAGTPIMPPNARPEAVDFYFDEVRHWGQY